MAGFSLPISRPPASGLGGYGLSQAHEMVKDVYDLVDDRLQRAVSDANEMRLQATETIDALRNADLNLTIPDPPPPPDIDGDYTITPITATPPERPIIEDIAFVLPERPTYVDIPEPTVVDIPEFVSPVVGVSLPTAPTLGSLPSEPAAPPIDTVSIDVPTPTLVMPELPTLSDVDVPDFDYSTLPVLNATIPELDLPSLSVSFNWQEPDYRPVVIDDVVSKIRELWSGRLGIPQYLENAMWERAVEREDIAAEREIGSVVNDYSARGFTVPPGVMGKRLDDLRSEHARRRSAVTRDITIEVAKIHVENVRFAVTQGLAAENVYYNIHQNAAQRLFEAERARVESQISVHNALVTSFNAKVQLFQAQISSYTTRLQAMIDVYKARVQGAVAKNELNSQRVQIYSTQIQAMNATVGLYEAQIRAAATKLDAVRNKVEIYRAQIQAYAERLNAARLPFEIYKTQVDAETAKYGIIDAEARAYSALVSGRVSQAEVQTKYAELKGLINDQKVKEYSANIDAEKARMQGQMQEIQAVTDVYRADIARYEAETRRDSSLTELQINAQQTKERILVAFYESQIKTYETRMRLITERTAQAIEAIKSAGSIASTLAAGAMAGINVGASLSGSAQTSGSGNSSYNESLSFQQGVNESMSTSTSIE